MSVKPTKGPTAAKPAEVDTTGHSWDGIEELNNPLPRWWLWTFYACIVWALAYSIAYPAWPMLSGATKGLLGYSTRAELAAEIKAADDANATISAKLVAADLTAIAADPELQGYAVSAGAAVFRTNCMQCHGAGAGGVKAKGYPNLLDDDWLWGGDIEAIHTTITHGIRNTSDPDARFSQMPAWGELLEPVQIDQLVQYVLQMSGQEHDAALAAEGAKVFVENENCVSCHGVDGKGNRELGSPNLTDAIWLYGGDAETLKATITYSRNGVMPNWNGRLSEANIRAVAAYVHQLGGGE
jgi:cytochrome c oxidase cbb3-type subunit III